MTETTGARNTAVVSGARSLLFDLDGCIWFGDRLAPGADELIAFLREAGSRVSFATNISSRTPTELADKLTGLGIPAEAETLLTPLRVLPYHPALQLKGSRAFVVGEALVTDMLRSSGVAVVDEPTEASAVVIGRTTRFDYATLAAAMAGVDAGAELLALNLDLRAPAADGSFSLPGTGVLAAAVATACGIEPTLIGKPSRFFFRTGLKLLDFHVSETTMVGDSLDSDIMGAHRAGLSTVLVGEGFRARGRSSDEIVEPDLHVSSLNQLVDIVRL